MESGCGAAPQPLLLLDTVQSFFRRQAAAAAAATVEEGSQSGCRVESALAFALRILYYCIAPARIKPPFIARTQTTSQTNATRPPPRA